MSIAARIERGSVVQGVYVRPPDRELEEAGGRVIESSNWDSEGRVIVSGYSFSPTETWSFPDGSLLEVSYSTCDEVTEHES
jgi:hypothetical protein